MWVPLLLGVTALLLSSVSSSMDQPSFQDKTENDSLNRQTTEIQIHPSEMPSDIIGVISQWLNLRDLISMHHTNQQWSLGVRRYAYLRFKPQMAEDEFIRLFIGCHSLVMTFQLHRHLSIPGWSAAILTERNLQIYRVTPIDWIPKPGTLTGRVKVKEIISEDTIPTFSRSWINDWYFIKDDKCGLHSVSVNDPSLRFSFGGWPSVTLIEPSKAFTKIDHLQWGPRVMYFRLHHSSKSFHIHQVFELDLMMDRNDQWSIRKRNDESWVLLEIRMDGILVRDLETRAEDMMAIHEDIQHLSLSPKGTWLVRYLHSEIVLSDPFAPFKIQHRFQVQKKPTKVVFNEDETHILVAHQSRSMNIELIDINQRLIRILQGTSDLTRMLWLSNEMFYLHNQRGCEQMRCVITPEVPILRPFSQMDQINEHYKEDDLICAQKLHFISQDLAMERSRDGSINQRARVMRVEWEQLNEQDIRSLMSI